ncbi:MAG: Yip1 family protein [Bacteroidota bacterium]
MSESSFNFNAFIRDSIDVLVKPKAYFSTMKTTGGIAEPLIKALIYGVIAGLIALIWGLLKIGGSVGLFGGAIGVMMFVWYVIGAVIGLFIGAVVLLVISAICKGSTDFEANARVTASLMIVMPVSALLGFVSGLNLTAGLIISLAIKLFSLYLLYHGLVEALKTKPQPAKILTIILAALLALFLLIGLGAKKTASKFLEEYDSKDLKELLEDIEKDTV